MTVYYNIKKDGKRLCMVYDKKAAEQIAKDHNATVEEKIHYTPMELVEMAIAENK